MGSQWPFGNNNSRFAEESHPIKHQYDPNFLTSERAIPITIIVMDFVAIITNCLTIVIIVFMATLRKCVSSLYAVHLCSLNLFASIASLVRSFKKLQSHGDVTEDSTIFCIIFDFLNGFFLYAIIFMVVTINFDKFYSIKFPMHYSSNVSKAVVLLVQCATTIISIVFAIMPPLMNENTHKTHCMMTYCHSSHTAAYSVTVAVIAFGIPVIMMMLINVSVYRVAKRSLAQIHSASTIMCDAFCFDKGNRVNANNGVALNLDSRENVTRTISVIEFGGECGAANAKDQLRPMSVCTLGSNNLLINGDLNSIASKQEQQKQLALSVSRETLASFGSLPGVVVTTDLGHPLRQKERKHSLPRTPTLIISPASPPFLSPKTSPIERTFEKRSQQFMSNGQRHRPEGIDVSRTNFKALCNLMIPFVYFILIWGPYFYAHLLQVNKSSLQNDDTLMRVSGLLVHLSFILNPIIYVGMKRNFKEEAVEFFRYFRWQPTNTTEINNTTTQTFQQFLNSTTV